MPELMAKCLKAGMTQSEEGKLDPVVQKTYKISDLNSAHLALEKCGTIGKTVVYW